ncbi:peptide chain release factor 1 [Thermoclostridium stercorarium subsp. stercorarium DSM 8532]|uniref:Peptide chain release factor 1 n=1 Tax=Thermoclostridium stercorarium (strain ATCC 35414 / DSM 8532 / NCIMB 11754) TaxID=1121335 RepID=L7VKM7_THES1|nr:peptide chain release factor 1 [Thermoclostridium stercorarium]AGC67214.1 peptide chain release factor 1 [Thermoclostridium stercorarium subsp. stercorarium DSM 8532]AGI38289.1 bacterial peptide chain release factor-1 [Thermoclostridium stercorarium subsp. stercorarium DSM 8532]
MFDKLEAIENKYEELNIKIADPAVISDPELYAKLMKEHSELSEIVEKYREYKKYKKNLQDAKKMLEEKPDKELRDMIMAEIEEAEAGIERTTRELKILMMPKDPNDEKNVIIEIRGGAGGEEAALFSADLYRMFTRYAERKNWTYEIIDANETELGGFKEIIFSIEGKGAYSRLKYESGVHRVQRVPTTESSGRIHTSTVTVAVLPEVDDVPEVQINPSDIRVDTFRASGAGGQHVNKTSSAIRITHIPTGIVVTCQDERSQHRNREKAMRVLKAKLYELAQSKINNEIAENRRMQVGTGDRSERIRTYNFPQGRVTDHRIGLTLYKLDQILDGDLDELIDALITEDQARKIASQE